MGRWCELPLDLVCEIDVKLTYIDKVRVRATCEWWNSALSKLPNHKLPQLPWLLQTNVDEEGAKSHALFNIREQKGYRVDLPQLEGKVLKGSSHGWLAMISVNQTETTPSSPDICLLHPLTGAQIQLPPRSTFPDVVNYDPNKVGKEYTFVSEYDGEVFNLKTNQVDLNLTKQIVTSTSPCSENCVVFVIYGEFCELAWCMPGHDKWTPLTLCSDSSRSVEDIIFSDNKAYVLNYHCQLFQIEDIGTLSPKVTKIISQVVKGTTHQMMISECSDGRLMLVTGAHDKDREVKKFEIYEFDVLNKCWRLVNNISNDMIFLGHNLTFSIPSCQFPGYRGNRVFFSDHPETFIVLEGIEGYANIGIFDIENNSIERLPGFKNVPRSLWPQPIWITPPNYC